MKSQFITTDELKNELNGGKKLFVFGVSVGRKVFLESLKHKDIPISYLVDNDKSRHGTFLEGIEIISPQELLEHQDRMVIIANSYFAEIYEQLEKMGVTEVYELTDINASSTMEMILAEDELKRKYAGESTDKVLIYVADGFGDNIIKYPFLERLSKSPDADNYYVYVDRQPNYDIYASLFKHVKMINASKAEVDKDYRSEVVEEVDKQHFKKKLCFCSTAYYCTHFDPFGAANTNIPIHEHFYEFLDWNNGRTKNKAHKDMELMASKLFGWDDLDLSVKGAFSDVLKGVEVDLPFEDRIVAIGMGGNSWGHAYKARDIAEVTKWFIQNGYRVVILGQGRKDETYNRLVARFCDYDPAIVNLTNQCSAFQSLKVIEKSDLFIGLDSALAHGAYALDKKAIVLMSGNNFSRRFMHDGDPKMIYLTEDLDCLGCYQCKYGLWNKQMNNKGLCFSSVSPERIIQTASKLLDM